MVESKTRRSNEQKLSYNKCFSRLQTGEGCRKYFGQQEIIAGDQGFALTVIAPFICIQIIWRQISLSTHSAIKIN